MSQVCGVTTLTTVTMTVATAASVSLDPGPAMPLAARAAAVGLSVLADAAWPESPADGTAPPIAGFVVSSFSPLAAEVARRCLSRRPHDLRADGDRDAGPGTAVILVSSLGDLASAVHVADAVDSADRVGPLLFFQSVPNAVAGYLAAKWRLAGPVVSVGAVAAGLEIAAALIEDGDADEALLVRIEQACDAEAVTETGDRAEAVLLGAGPLYNEGEVT